MYYLVTADPGKQGAIIYWDVNLQPVKCIMLKEYSIAVWGVLPQELKDELHHTDVAVVERARAWSTDGAMGAFAYGYCYALLLDALRSRAEECILYEPRTWQRALKEYINMQPPGGLKITKWAAYLFCKKKHFTWLKENVYNKRDIEKGDIQLAKKYDGVHDALVMGEAWKLFQA